MICGVFIVHACLCIYVCIKQSKNIYLLFFELMALSSLRVKTELLPKILAGTLRERERERERERFRLSSHKNVLVVSMINTS